MNEIEIRPSFRTAYAVKTPDGGYEVLLHVGNGKPRSRGKAADQPGLVKLKEMLVNEYAKMGIELWIADTTWGS